MKTIGYFSQWLKEGPCWRKAMELKGKEYMWQIPCSPWLYTRVRSFDATMFGGSSGEWSGRKLGKPMGGKRGRGERKEKEERRKKKKRGKRRRRGTKTFFDHSDSNPCLTERNCSLPSLFRPLPSSFAQSLTTNVHSSFLSFPFLFLLFSFLHSLVLF